MTYAKQNVIKIHTGTEFENGKYFRYSLPNKKTKIVDADLIDLVNTQLPNIGASNRETKSFTTKGLRISFEAYVTVPNADRGGFMYHTNVLLPITGSWQPYLIEFDDPNANQTFRLQATYVRANGQAHMRNIYVMTSNNSILIESNGVLYTFDGEDIVLSSSQEITRENFKENGFSQIGELFEKNLSFLLENDDIHFLFWTDDYSITELSITEENEMVSSEFDTIEYDLFNKEYSLRLGGVLKSTILFNQIQYRVFIDDVLYLDWSPYVNSNESVEFFIPYFSLNGGLNEIKVETRSSSGAIGEDIYEAYRVPDHLFLKTVSYDFHFSTRRNPHINKYDFSYLNNETERNYIFDYLPFSVFDGRSIHRPIYADLGKKDLGVSFLDSSLMFTREEHEDILSSPICYYSHRVKDRSANRHSSSLVDLEQLRESFQHQPVIPSQRVDVEDVYVYHPQVKSHRELDIFYVGKILSRYLLSDHEEKKSTDIAYNLNFEKVIKVSESISPIDRTAKRREVQESIQQLPIPSAFRKQIEQEVMKRFDKMSDRDIEKIQAIDLSSHLLSDHESMEALKIIPFLFLSEKTTDSKLSYYVDQVKQGDVDSSLVYQYNLPVSFEFLNREAGIKKEYLFYQKESYLAYIEQKNTLSVSSNKESRYQEYLFLVDEKLPTEAQSIYDVTYLEKASRYAGIDPSIIYIDRIGKRSRIEQSLYYVNKNTVDIRSDFDLQQLLVERIEKDIRKEYQINRMDKILRDVRIEQKNIWLYKKEPIFWKQENVIQFDRIEKDVHRIDKVIRFDPTAKEARSIYSIMQLDREKKDSIFQYLDIKMDKNMMESYVEHRPIIVDSVMVESRLIRDSLWSNINEKDTIRLLSSYRAKIDNLDTYILPSYKQSDLEEKTSLVIDHYLTGAILLESLAITLEDTMSSKVEFDTIIDHNVSLSDHYKELLINKNQGLARTVLDHESIIGQYSISDEYRSRIGVAHDLIQSNRQNKTEARVEHRPTYAGDQSAWEDIWKRYTDGIDILDPPDSDFDYTKLANQVHDENGVPYRPLSPTNVSDVKVDTPLHHPLPEHFGVGIDDTKVLAVDNHVIIEVILALESLKFRNKLRYAGMPAERTLREIFDELYKWIQGGFGNHPEFERMFRFARWYGEHVLVQSSKHILHREYDSFKSKLHQFGDLGIPYTSKDWVYRPAQMTLATTSTVSSLSFELENFIDGEVILRGYFDNPLNQGTMKVMVDGIQMSELPTSYNGPFELTFDVEQGKHEYELEFNGSSGIVSLSSMEVTGCVFKRAWTTSDESDSNGLKLAQQLIDLLLHYYDIHHGDDKVKGTMETKQRKVWNNQ